MTPDDTRGDRVLRVSSSKLVRTLKGHLKGVSNVAFSPDASQVVSRQFDGVTKLWSLDDKPIADATREAEDLFGSAPNLEIESRILSIGSPEGRENIDPVYLAASRSPGAN